MNHVIQAMIMALIVAVSIGYVFIWIMVPTNIYRQNWVLKIQAKTNYTTYFGSQGRNLLVFTFPVFFVATLGCVYLHLGKKRSINNHDYGSKRKDAKNGALIWKRPVVIKGLGIVSGIELAFLVMFIALLVWFFAVYLRVAFMTQTSSAHHYHHQHQKSGLKVWQSRLANASFRLGMTGNLGLTFLFFPVTRGSSVLQFFGLTSEASIKYHIWIGHIVMVLFTAHSLGYVIFWAVTNDLYEMLRWDKARVSNVAGEIAWVAGLGLWATTFPRIRRKMFELFFYTHHLYIIFMLFFVLHVGIDYTFLMLPAFYLFMIDRFLRFLQSRQNVRLVSARLLPCETLELNFSKTKGLSYTPTSIVFMNVPSISKLQWHPFTISSSSNLEPEKLSVIIKGEGSWCKKLHQVLSSPSSVEHLDVSVEGPYGPTSSDFLRHDLMVMVSGGSGVTPFISIIRELMHASEMLKCKTPSVFLVSSFKNSSDLTILDLLLPINVGSPTEFSNFALQIEAYVTREKQPAAAQDQVIKKPSLVRTLWFKPKPTDAPLAPILGKNSWLWLGAIISASFIMYLVFIGILTRYYIYPIDHNTNKIYSWTSRAVLNILFMCISIVITGTAAFLWNKKQNAMENIQIQNMEGATPVSSLNSSIWFYNADRELESLPQESQLVLSTNLHYGERPDLKKILFECKESSVGVLVCGPKGMRHEVANICSSGLGANLHLESISFSW